MGRVHLFEFEDQAWFPAMIRRYMTDYLEYTARLSEAPFEAISSKLASAMKRTQDTRVLDLCSGGGGPMPLVARLIREKEGIPVEGTLSDLYPNLPAFGRAAAGEKGISYSADPVNATGVPAEAAGFRTMFNSFHHFRPEQARAILEDAARAGRGIAVFEMVGRSFFGFFSVSTLLIGMALFTPFIRPRTFTRFLFTYLIPLVPLFSLWDGYVSCLRVYSPKELKRLTDSINIEGYEWETGRLPFGKAPGSSVYLIGVPAKRP